MSPENSGLGLRERESTELHCERGWEGAAKTKWELHGDRPWRNLSFGQQYQTCLSLPRKTRVKVQLPVDRQRNFRAVACAGLKGSEVLILACPPFLTTWVSVHWNSALSTSSRNFLFINPVYLHKECAVPSTLFCPLIFCTAKAITACSYRAIWDIYITENTLQAWKSISTRLVQHTHKTESSLFFPSKESRNLSMEARLDHIIPLLLHWL